MSEQKESWTTDRSSSKATARNPYPASGRTPGGHRPLLDRSFAPAFTLLELLVVIAVIAILAALLLPALSRGRSAADGAVCKSNLRQIEIALRMYEDAFNAYPPLTGAYPPQNGYGLAWYQALQPYLAAQWPEYNRTASGQFFPRSGVYCCPGFNRVPGFYGGSPLNAFPSPVSGAYGYNQYGVGWGAGSRVSPGDTDLGIGGVNLLMRPGLTNYVRATREAEVVKPADMITVGDSVLGSGDQSGYGYYDLEAGMNNPALRPSPSASSISNLESMRAPYRRRHSARFNVLFCDGHIEYLRAEKVFDVSNDSIAQRWNKDNKPHRELLPPWH